MADFLSSLLSDPAALQSALQMASTVLGSAPAVEDTLSNATAQGAAVQDRPTAPERPTIADSPPMPSASLPLLGTLPSTARTQDYDPTADMMARVMPTVQRVMASGQGAIDPQKRQLLGAIKPFLGETAALQIDHGMRLVALARMARAAIQVE